MSIYKGNRVVAGTYPLYGTTGESTAGPMTQKAVTEALSLTKRNVGELVTSVVPLTDAGLHLLDGALLSYTGMYAPFINHMEGLFNTYQNLFTTEASWQSAVQSKGVCGKFVLNKTMYAWEITVDGGSQIVYTYVNEAFVGDIAVLNPDGTTFGQNYMDSTMPYRIVTITEVDPSDPSLNTIQIKFTSIPQTRAYAAEFTGVRSTVNDITGTGSLRLPKITGIIEGTTDVEALGDLIEAGLPSMTTNSTGAHGHDVFLWNSNNTNYTAQHWNSDGTSPVTAGSGTRSTAASWQNSSFTTAGNSLFSGSGDPSGVTDSKGAHTHTVSFGAETDTVQPQTIKVLYYIVVANTPTTEVQVDINEVASDINALEGDINNLNANKLSRSEVWYDSTSATLYIGVPQS